MRFSLRGCPPEMSRPASFTHCVGSPTFSPEDLIQDVDRQKQALDLLAKDDLYNASRVLLQLPEQDLYTYHAVTSVRLAQVQRVVSLGAVNGLHTWYRNEDGSPVSKQAFRRGRDDKRLKAAAERCASAG